RLQALEHPREVAMPRTYKLVSSDSHLEIPPERWTHRISQQYRELAPRLIKMPNGGDALLIDGTEPVVNSSDMYAGPPATEWDPFKLSYSAPAGTGSPEQRLKEQDVDQVEAEVLFPGQQAGPSSGAASRTTRPSRQSSGPTTSG